GVSRRWCRETGRLARSFCVSAGRGEVSFVGTAFTRRFPRLAAACGLHPRAAGHLLVREGRGTREGRRMKAEGRRKCAVPNLSLCLLPSALCLCRRGSTFSSNRHASSQCRRRARSSGESTACNCSTASIL